MNRRRESWGTFCPTCRTVRLRSSSIFCIGNWPSGTVPSHPLTLIEVLS